MYTKLKSLSTLAFTVYQNQPFISLLQWNIPDMKVQYIVWRILLAYACIWSISLQSGERIICLYIYVNICVWVEHMYTHTHLCVRDLFSQNDYLVTARIRSKMATAENVNKICTDSCRAWRWRWGSYFGAKEVITAFSWANSNSVKHCQEKKSKGEKSNTG